MNVLLIQGSARPHATGKQVSQWVAESLAQQQPHAQINVVDLANFALPFDAEPNMAATGQYVSEQTKRWSQTVQQADYLIFISPEYNGSYPAALKNAIDHLMQEWANKPAVIVAYSPSGANGVAEQLTALLTRLKVKIKGVQKIATYELGFNGATGVAENFAEIKNTPAQAELERLLTDLLG